MKYEVSGMFRCIVEADSQRDAERETMKRTKDIEIYIVEVEKTECLRGEGQSNECKRVST